MIQPPLPPDEAQRLSDLHRLGILDSDPEPSFDRITRIAAELIGSPISLISLLDGQRQWFKSRVGLNVTETPRQISFCTHAIMGNDLFVVLDAELDPRFSHSVLVNGAPHIRFYAGAPLKRVGGSAFGTLCVIDTKPRPALSEAQAAILTELAGIVTDQMEQRLLRNESDLSRRAQERKETERRKLQEAIRHTQSLFIGGSDPDLVFGELLARLSSVTGSRAGCIANLVADPANPDALRVCASIGEHALMPLMRSAVTTRRDAEQGGMIASPVFHGDQIVGVIGFDHRDPGGLAEARLHGDAYLDSIAGLFVASRARNEGRQNARAIRLRDRALASITSGVCIVDPGTPGGSILYANAAFEMMSGYRAQELEGRQFGVMNGSETDPGAIELIQEALTKGIELDTTLRSYHRDGTAFWNRIRLSPVRDADGGVDYFVSVNDDVTEKMEADAELLRAKEAAERHARVTSQFMANMSHEIRTPMNGVIGMTGLLLDSDLTEEQRDYAETIRSSGEGLLTIINEILDFSRIDSGSVQLEVTEFDLCGCIESAMDLVASSAARKALDLEYLLDPGVPKTLLGDSTRLRQVLINLLGNAVKFTSHGSVLLSVSGSCLKDRSWDLHFAVQDTGIGIPESRCADIFKPFQQADSSSTRRYGGTGLGLSISKHLTELMGGRIWVESQLGAGSVFHFTIRVEADAASALAETVIEDSGLEGRRVLVLDPNPGSQAVLKQHLEAWGMCPRVYASVAEAEADNHSRAFDVVIVDNDLPGLALEQLTSSAADTPLLVLCSLGRRDFGLARQLRGRTSPRSRLHSKPIKPSYLCSTLAAFLSGEPVRITQRSQRSTADPQFAVQCPFSILVVEDNPVNQKLVLLLLSKLGYRADTANNGLEAVRALQRRHYDVLFMDMHMPEMDGVEATRRIREIMPASDQPWIVALTANAMQSDRDLCLRAGMQAFVTKPVQLSDVKNSLLEAKRGRDLPAESPGDQAQVWVVPEYLTELMADEPSVANELIDLFESETRPQISELRSSVNDEDAARIKKILHGLKGSCVQIGALITGNHCMRMEQDLETLSIADRLRLTAEIEQCFEQATNRMRSVAVASA